MPLSPAPIIMLSPVRPAAHTVCDPWSAESGNGESGAAAALCEMAVPCQLCSLSGALGASQCTAGCAASHCRAPCIITSRHRPNSTCPIRHVLQHRLRYCLFTGQAAWHVFLLTCTELSRRPQLRRGAAHLENARCHTDSQNITAIRPQADVVAIQPLQVLLPVCDCSMGWVMACDCAGVQYPCGCGIAHQRKVHADVEPAAPVRAHCVYRPKEAAATGCMLVLQCSLKLPAGSKLQNWLPVR